MRIFLKLFKIELDKSRYLKAVDTKLIQIHKNALRDFIRAVYPKVPVDTGQARGSLVPFARSVNAVIPIAPKTFRKDRSPTTGAAASSFEIILTKGRYVATLDVNLGYYEFLDIHKGRSPTSEWFSFLADKKAYKKSINRQLGSKLRNLPKIKEFFTFVRITNRG